MVDTSKQKKLSMGWIPYWNLLPLKYEIMSHQAMPLQMKTAAPTVVNKWLETGEIDLAPCSSVCLF